MEEQEGEEGEEEEEEMRQVRSRIHIFRHATSRVRGKYVTRLNRESRAYSSQTLGDDLEPLFREIAIFYLVHTRNSAGLDIEVQGGRRSGREKEKKKKKPKKQQRQLET